MSKQLIVAPIKRRSCLSCARCNGIIYHFDTGEYTRFCDLHKPITKNKLERGCTTYVRRIYDEVN